MEIVEQLVHIYKTEDYYQRGNLTDLEIRRYYSKMIAHGRIQLYMETCNVVGFIESWRLNYEQLGRVVCWHDFSALEEDVNNGDILYISDIYVAPHKRGNGIVKILMEMLENSNRDALYGVSKRVKSKKVQYYRVYDKKVAYKLNKENTNG